ncbi:MAG: VOC family protein [Micropruina sp.]
MIDTVHYPTEGLPDFQADMAGDVLTVEFELGGYRMIGINADATFRPNPSVSFSSTSTCPSTRTPGLTSTSCGGPCRTAARR